MYLTFLIIFVYCRNLCPNGTYSLGAQIKCSPCIPGSKCPSITEGPTICPPGYSSERNAEDCKLCEAGKQCADPACKHVNPKKEAFACMLVSLSHLRNILNFALYLSAPEPCPPGYYSSVGWIQCLPCKRGFRCKEGSTTDSPPEGQFNLHFSLLHVCSRYILLCRELHIV